MRYLVPLFLVLLCASPTRAQSDRPILISQTTSTRAIAFESPSFTTEPFALNSTVPWGVDQRTRVLLFAMNLKLSAGENLSAITADAEDGQGHFYSLKVEYLGPVPGQEWLSAVVVRLSDDLSNVGDVLVRLSYHSVSSNRVRMGIGHIGGGLPDDEGSAPTPAPPYTLGGRVTTNGAGLGNVLLTLSGAQSGTLMTDANGAYSFLLGQFGSYTLTPSSPLYNFSPQTVTFDFLTGNHADVNFVATRVYSISGQLKDINSSALAGIPVTLSGNFVTQTVVTNSQGVFVFQRVESGHDYTLASASDIFTFTQQGVHNLSSDLQFNLQATRRLYTVSGRLTDEDSLPITNFQVTLSGNSTTQTVTTNYQGVFVFQNVEAGHDYGITPVSDNVFVFVQGVQNLSSDLGFNIQPLRRRFDISGHVMEGAKPVSGAIVSLSGWESMTATTDATGAYLFPELKAGRSYAVAVAKTYFSFNPQSRSVESLENNQEFNFQGTPTYHLTGRVTDERGNGLANVRLTLAGAESAVFLTASDGLYAFTLHSTGDYTLTPSADQGFFTFSPVTLSLAKVNGDRSADFMGALSLATDPSYVLEFDGTPKTVDCGFFWPDDRPLGHFFWEVWAAPGQDTGARYMISDGYGGTHAILFGFGQYNNFEPQRYQLSGNFWTGVASNSIYYGGDDGPAVGEWGHLAVGWDGHQIITYFNGVPVGRVSYSGQRWRVGIGGGGGRLLIGGSDHNNLVGRIAQVRGYEETNPREAASVTAAFAPQAVFSREGSYLGYFFRQSQIIADMSNYYQGQPHRGLLRGVTYGVINDCPDCPPPQFVLDPGAPKFLDASPANNSAPVASAKPSPADALIFDSFSRANSTYALGKGGLGSTEDGSTGQQQWRTVQTNGFEPFGILNGRAVVLANEVALAWVPTGSLSGNVDVRVERHPGPWGSGLDTGVAFRVRDGQHFFFAYTSGGDDDPGDARKLTIGYYLNGVRTDLVTNISVPGLWTQLKVISTNDGQITVLTDKGFAYSLNSPILESATGAGLYNSGPGRGLLNRWDNFTVYNAP